MQVLLRAMLVNSLHAALENAVEAFDSVSMHLAAPIFTGAVVNTIMVRKVIADLLILSGFISHNRRFLRDVFFDDWDKIVCARSIDMERTNLAAIAIHEAQNSVLVRITATLDRSRLLANERLVNLNYSTSATHRRGKASRAHGFAQAMTHEPCGLQRGRRACGEVD